MLITLRSERVNLSDILKPLLKNLGPVIFPSDKFFLLIFQSQ